MMEKSVYKLGKTCIEIHKPKDMSVPVNMQKFVAEDVASSEICMRYYVEYTEQIAALQEQYLALKVPGKEAIRDTLHLFQTSKGECRFISLPGSPVPYAVMVRESEHVCRVWANRDYHEWMEIDVIFASMLALEKLMIEADGMILHSAYMCYNDQAVLFSAPSETGKSTQASLWEQYRGTWTVNGDRSLLLREESGWMAHGWPICGSSEICHNRAYPIRAIVMLKQAKVNRAYRLKGFPAVREVMEQITINGWDSEFQIKSLELIEQLLSEVEVYRLECDISEDAVACLEKALQGE